ncbi:MAG: CopD family protein [Alphaproteobacteria bacterium]
MDLFNLVRGLHIITVMAWIAGLLMLPRFYAYQTGSQPGGELEAKMITASRSLRAIIITPSMIAAWALGIWLFLLHRETDWAGPLSNVPHWFWLKLVLVLGLSGYHGYLVSQGRKLAKGERKHTEKFWRMMSEVPFLIAIVVVLLATVEPF